MALRKRMLAAIPVEPCPDCADTQGKLLIMQACQKDVENVRLLIATFYDADKHSPVLRIYCSEDSHVTYRYDRKRWSNAKLCSQYSNQTGCYYYGRYAEVRRVSFIADATSASAGPKFFHDSSAEDTLEAIERFQEEVEARRADERACRDKELTRQIMSRFPSPPDVEQAILEGPMKASRYLFFRSKRVKDGCTGKQVRRYYGYCTHCKQEHLLSEKPQHKSGGRCPGCGSEVTMMARGIQRSFLADRCEYMVFSKDQEGNVYLHHLHVVRDYAGIPEQVQTRIQEVSRYYFTGMHAYKFTRRYNAYQQPNPAEKWEKNVRCSEPSDANGLLKYTIHPIPWGFFDDTCLSNARLGEYLQSTAGSSEASVYYRIHAERQNPIQYLNFYLKHPNIENLITAELMHLVLDILKKPGDFRKIRLDKARPRDILGLSQPEVRMAAKYKMSFQDINMYKRCKEILHAIDAEDLSIILEFSKALPGRLDDMIAAERLRKDLTYCKRQKHRGEYPSYVILYCQWEDYHRECRQLGYDLSDEYYHYPPDLQKAHRRTMEQVAEKERQKLEKQQQEELPKWAALYHELEGLCYSDGQLLIRPVASRAELVEEGTKLHHCVASYGNRVVEGKTWIFFIRKVEDPDSPYYTLNLSPECELIQCHGYGNDADQPEKIRPQFIRDFEKKWLEKVVKPWKKRRDKEKAEICIQIPAA